MNADIEIVRSDLVRFLKSTTVTFDFIFLDPIWSEEPVYCKAIQFIAERSLLKQSGTLFVEHDRTLNIEDYGMVSKQYQYGNSFISNLIPN